VNTFLTWAITDFFLAFGVVFGGSMFAGIASVFMMMPPATMMMSAAGQLKIWALVAAVGGSVDPLRVIESNIVEGNLSPVAIQVGYMLVSFLGAHIGTEFVRFLCRGAG
jgi:hypothetical protein